jgi:hypothetical protein
MRLVEGEWAEVDLFFEAGIGYMRDHLQAGGQATIDENFTHGKGFPLGAWVAEMRQRNGAGALTTAQKSQIEELPGWRWDG